MTDTPGLHTLTVAMVHNPVVSWVSDNRGISLRYEAQMPDVQDLMRIRRDDMVSVEETGIMIGGMYRAAEVTTQWKGRWVVGVIRLTPLQQSAMPLPDSHIVANRTEPARSSALPRVILLHGKPGVGKDTVAARLVDIYGYQQLAFADQPRRDVEALVPFIGDRVQSLMRKGSTWREAWDEYKRREPVAREKLQQYAEMVKPHAGEDVWGRVVAHLIEDNPDERFVVSDLRFEAELRAVEAVCPEAKIITVLRPSRADVDSGHVSERWSPLTDVDRSMTIFNVGSVEDLHRYVDQVVTGWTS